MNHGPFVDVDRPRSHAEATVALLSIFVCHGVSPEAVDDAVVEAFLSDWEETGLSGPMRKADDGSFTPGTTCSETISGWPTQRLAQSAVRSVARGSDWEAFPARTARRG